jgi:hypothetical protein
LLRQKNVQLQSHFEEDKTRRNEMHQYVLWFALAAYALHAMEELILDWRKWAVTELKFVGLEWHMFYMTNAALMFVALAAAMIGWKFPAFGLIIPALMLINGIIFHIIPTIRSRILSPGVITATVLFLPISIGCYYAAGVDGALTWGTGIGSFILGGLLMASPIYFVKLHEKMKVNKGNVSVTCSVPTSLQKK